MIRRLAQQSLEPTWGVMQCRETQKGPAKPESRQSLARLRSAKALPSFESRPARLTAAPKFDFVRKVSNRAAIVAVEPQQTT
jgi:hypothetical protein